MNDNDDIKRLEGILYTIEYDTVKTQYGPSTVERFRSLYNGATGPWMHSGLNEYAYEQAKAHVKACLFMAQLSQSWFSINMPTSDILDILNKEED